MPSEPPSTKSPPTMPEAGSIPVAVGLIKMLQAKPPQIAVGGAGNRCPEGREKVGFGKVIPWQAGQGGIRVRQSQGLASMPSALAIKA